jgi:cellobiose phosphorylase
MKPHELASGSGLRVLLNSNGSIRRMDCGGLLLSLFLGNELEGGPANLWLRCRGSRIEWVPLLGPASPAEFAFDAAGFEANGEWHDLRFRVALRLARSAAAWFWHVELENAGSAGQELDLVWAQDLSLADYSAVRNNEFYVSHYVDYTPLAHPACGTLLAVRQNLPMGGGRHPWALVGSLGRCASWASDALQLHGLATRSGIGPEALAAPALPARRLQHEHSMALLQEEPFELAPGARAARGFFGWIEADHPAASAAPDLAFAERALALPEARAPFADGTARAPGAVAARTLFGARPPLAALELDETELTAHFGAERRELELGAGRPLSFFTGPDRHVVLRAKELAVLRPHGQILRTGSRLVPDEASLTSTVWMAGVFHSMLTQGHVSLNRLLSSAHGYLGLFRAVGQRIFAEREGGWELLDVPSAFEMAPGQARWLYKHADGLIEVRSSAPVDRHALELQVRVLAGGPTRFLVVNGLAIDGDDGAEGSAANWARDGRGVVVRFAPGSELGRRFPEGCFRIEPESGNELARVGGDELLFLDGRPHGQPVLALVSQATQSFGLRITGPLGAGEPGTGQTAERFWKAATGLRELCAPAGSPLAADVARLREILPWFAHDALIHYLAPRGLEQYTGGGWGTRDVTQGPAELLLALGRFDELRDLLLRVFRAQNPDGDWPQWFMFFERDRGIRAPDSHGDVVFWPLLALAHYLLAAEDGALLDEPLPFFNERGDAHAERATLMRHVERALGVIAKRVIPGTQLAAFGNGDWNDSLQPADPSMCERLCSSWTVALHYQTFRLLARALRCVDRADRAAALEATAARIRDDFERLLLPGGVLAGFAWFQPDGRIEPLLHPEDRSTGIGYRLLPMMHAISSELFTREQAEAHVGHMRRHLLGPDGARLFDRPHRYRGGLERLFRRAESAAHFGREVALMYTHAHLRFAEAMARWGDADALFLALRQANPIAIGTVVRGARPRQGNCYYTSSDAVFADRYEAQTRYAELRSGSVEFEGGWRVYSSGPGVAVRLIHQCFLGLRRGRRRLWIDPVIPRALDGLRAGIEIGGSAVEVEYRIRELGHGPTALWLNGRPLAFESEPNPYRAGGAQLSLETLRDGLVAGSNRLVIELR